MSANRITVCKAIQKWITKIDFWYSHVHIRGMNSVHCISTIDLIFLMYIGSSFNDVRVNCHLIVTHNLCLASEKARRTYVCSAIICVAKIQIREFVWNFALKTELSRVKRLKCWRRPLATTRYKNQEFMSGTNAFEKDEKTLKMTQGLGVLTHPSVI